MLKTCNQFFLTPKLEKYVQYKCFGNGRKLTSVSVLTLKFHPSGCAKEVSFNLLKILMHILQAHKTKLISVDIPLLSQKNKQRTVPFLAGKKKK